MAILLHSTSRQIPRPILIDAGQLAELQRIFDTHYPPLHAFNELKIKEEAAATRIYLPKGATEADKAAEIEKVLERLRSNYRYEETQSFTLYLTGGRTLQAKTFTEALNQPHNANERPTGFMASMKVGDVRAKVELQADLYHGMSVSVEPNPLDLAQEFFGALNNWANDIALPRWQQWWLEWKAMTWLALGMWLLFGLLAPLMQYDSSAPSQSKVEAREMLKAGGVNSANEQRALTLLLAMESNYGAESFRLSLGPGFWAWYSLGVVFLISAGIWPRVSIGLWDGKKRVERWRRWLVVWKIEIPTLVFMTLIVPWVWHLLKIAPPSP